MYILAMRSRMPLILEGKLVRARNLSPVYYGSSLGFLNINHDGSTFERTLYGLLYYKNDPPARSRICHFLEPAGNRPVEFPAPQPP